MNPVDTDWKDLGRLWQAEGAAVSIDELEQYRQRERRAMHALAAVEFAGIGLGIGIGVWLGIASHYAWMSKLFIVVCLVMAWLTYRSRTEPEPLGGDDLMTSLRASLSREDWVASQLGFGRALSFVVLYVILMLSSDLLRNFATTPGAALMSLAACGAWVCGVIAWNYILVRRSTRRRRRLEGYADRLKRT